MDFRTINARPKLNTGRVLAALGLAAIVVPMTFSAVNANEVKIVGVKAKGTDRSYTFHVTLAHEDSGWDHYADKWEVLSPSGDVLGTRVLLHPHENEQPFTRSLSGVAVPSGLSHVMIRAHDKVHGDSETQFKVELKN